MLEKAEHKTAESELAAGTDFWLLSDEQNTYSLLEEAEQKAAGADAEALSWPNKYSLVCDSSTLGFKVSSHLLPKLSLLQNFGTDND